MIYSSCRRCTLCTAAARANKDAVAALMPGKPATEADILNRWSDPVERLRTAAFASLLFAAAFLVIYALARRWRRSSSASSESGDEAVAPLKVASALTSGAAA